MAGEQTTTRGPLRSGLGSRRLQTGDRARDESAPTWIYNHYVFIIAGKPAVGVRVCVCV